jgi:protein-tyrosine-phosphatase
VLLPISVVATVVGLFTFITLMNWWQYAGRREFFGFSIPWPRRLTLLSGICTAVIIGTTTLAFTFGGLSIVLVLVLLRGGVLVIAPLVDATFSRRVRWFSWAAMLTSLLAVLVVLADASNYKVSAAAIIDVAAYLTAYFFKLQFMTRLAKTNDQHATRRYFVEEVMIASPLLLASLAVLAAIGVGNVMTGFKLGFTTFLSTRGAIFAILVGLSYAGLNVCTTLIFLDRRENTFCVPMHCGSSLLSGLTAAYVLTFLFNQTPSSTAQVISAGLIIVALGFLSPLHHFDRVLNRIKSLFVRTPALLPQRERLFLFVCSGNTCRSPMAAAIANAEIAARFQIPFDDIGTVNVRALSAGVTARVGAPLTPEAQEVLNSLSVPARPHAARNLNLELANQAEIIFCMTSAQRQAVIELIPDVAWKTFCLDAEKDLSDPIGMGMAVYLECARRIQELVRMRLDELVLQRN